LERQLTEGELPDFLELEKIRREKKLKVSNKQTFNSDWNWDNEQILNPMINSLREAGRRWGHGLVDPINIRFTGGIGEDDNMSALNDFRYTVAMALIIFRNQGYEHCIYIVSNHLVYTTAQTHLDPTTLLSEVERIIADPHVANWQVDTNLNDIMIFKSTNPTIQLELRTGVLTLE
ncbi:hypothetical protein LCGC14_2331450, partial [marine sediment metagenome]